MWRKDKPLDVLIGSSSQFKGDLLTKGVARIDGSIEGNLQADFVIVGESGKIKGNVQSRGVIVDGKIEGNIEAQEVTEIRSHGEVMGDIRTAKLVISEGGIFEGHSYMKALREEERKDVVSIEDRVTKKKE